MHFGSQTKYPALPFFLRRGQDLSQDNSLIIFVGYSNYHPGKKKNGKWHLFFLTLSQVIKMFSQ